MPAMDTTEFDKELAVYMKDWPEVKIDLHSAMVGWNLRSTSPNLFENERQAIREEARAEFVDVMALTGVSQQMVDYAVRGLNAMPGTKLYLRLPPKKRPMTREEKTDRLKSNGTFPNMFNLWPQLSDSTFDELYGLTGLPYEVEE